MKIIKPSVEFYGAVPTDYAGALKFIELAGRTCYKSEGKITGESAEPFVRRLIKSGHLAMVEHSNFVVRLPLEVSPEHFITPVGKHHNHKVDDNFVYIGGNLVAWFQSATAKGPDPVFDQFYELYGDIFDLDMRLYDGGCGPWQVCPHDEIPKELHRYSAKFVCDRGVSHELVRHRPCSFAQESTRYVNYAGKEMEFIEPWWWDSSLHEIADGQHVVFHHSCSWGEQAYNSMIMHKATPQQARAVLPNALKTEIVVTADAAEWRRIRKLRTAKDAHPDMQRVMNMMPWEEFL